MRSLTVTGDTNVIMLMIALVREVQVKGECQESPVREGGTRATKAAAGEALAVD